MQVPLKDLHGLVGFVFSYSYQRVGCTFNLCGAVSIGQRTEEGAKQKAAIKGIASFVQSCMETPEPTLATLPLCLSLSLSLSLCLSLNCIYI